jgi:hypothetical protein
VIVYIGYYKKRIRLSPEPSATNPEVPFALALGFTFTGNTKLLAFAPNVFNVSKG